MVVSLGYVGRTDEAREAIRKLSAITPGPSITVLREKGKFRHDRMTEFYVVNRVRITAQLIDAMARHTEQRSRREHWHIAPLFLLSLICFVILSYQQPNYGAPTQGVGGLQGGVGMLRKWASCAFRPTAAVAVTARLIAEREPA
jgi:hypothetical protein